MVKAAGETVMVAAAAREGAATATVAVARARGAGEMVMVAVAREGATLGNLDQDDPIQGNGSQSKVVARTAGAVREGKVVLKAEVTKALGLKVRVSKAVVQVVEAAVEVVSVAVVV